MGWSRRVTAGAIVATLVSASAVVPALSASAASPGVNDGGRRRQRRAGEVHPEHRRRRRRSRSSRSAAAWSSAARSPTVTPTAGAGRRHGRHPQLPLRVQRHDRARSTPRSPRRSTVRSTRSSRPPTAPASTSAAVHHRRRRLHPARRVQPHDRRPGHHLQPVAERPDQRLALVGSRLFVAGTFTVVEERRPTTGWRRSTPTTGALDPYLSINLTGHHNFGRVAGRRRRPRSARPTSRSRPTARG